MPIMDFPSNPSDGQISGNYIWSASAGAWRSRPAVSTVTIHSATAPTLANAGDVWFNTNTGISFTYYDDGTNRQWVEMLSSAVPAVNAIMPAGTIVQTARATAPDLWLFCDGSAISRSTYASLFAAIGTSYGSGDGSTTFNLPNLQGRVPVGKTSSGTFAALGSTGGTETVTLTVAQMPSHTHVQNAHTHSINEAWSDANATHNHGSSAGFVAQGQTINRGGTYVDPSAIVSATATNQNTGGDGAHNNLQPYIVLNYMIKV